MSPTYKCWSDIWQRCTNLKSTGYKNYGGRGISVDVRWRSFEAFLADVGERPIGMTLERRDNSKGYSPDNCYWATAKQQARNRRNTKFEPHEPEQIRWLAGEGYGPAEIARHFEVSRALVWQIIKGQIWT